MHRKRSTVRMALAVTGILALCAPARAQLTGIVGLGDSLTHGTMDATNNSINTLNSWLELVSQALMADVPVVFQQPLFDVQEQRIDPFLIPSNLAVDGADLFSAEGLEYYKRGNTPTSQLVSKHIADQPLPNLLADNYDKVIFPINVGLSGAATQVDAAEWLIAEGADLAGIDEVLVFFWFGNNDSSGAALGTGGTAPENQPIPLGEIQPEIDPFLWLVLLFGRLTNEVSFDPYTLASIDRKLTEVADFEAQLAGILDRLEAAAAASAASVNFVLMTLPYYSSIGYLMDSEDLEFYLQKLNPAYQVPSTFARVAPPGQPIVDPTLGDRISLLTFGFMYALLDSGHPVNYVNQILQNYGRQRDGMVLSQSESAYIRGRIDAFNDAIMAEAAARPLFHLSDIGAFLNAGLNGQMLIEVNGRPLTRKWIRGSGFSFDGVHPGYTGQALIANYVLEDLGTLLGYQTTPYDLDLIHASDPYVDQDLDGFAAGPGYPPQGFTELLFLFRDADDQDANVGAVLPPDTWDRISAVLLDVALGDPELAAEAERLRWQFRNQPGAARRLP